MYDEIVFTNPTAKFYRQLMAYSNQASSSLASGPAVPSQPNSQVANIKVCYMFFLVPY